MIWSAVEFPPSDMAALPPELPAGVALVVGAANQAPSVEAASPTELFVLSSDDRADASPLSILAPGSAVVRLRGKTEVPR